MHSRYSAMWLLVFALLSFCLVSPLSQAAPGEIVFQATGASFAAILTVDSGATISWVFGDGTTSDSASPNKDYGTAALRENRLTVTPWSALKGINIGYDAGDGGPYTIPFLDPQNVVAVTGLENAAPYLQLWCSSHNPIETLDFSNFTQLAEIECFLCQSLSSVNLHNTPLLARACFEDNNLAALDLSECPSLADLRGAVNAYTSITWGTTGAQVWHICVRDNPQMTSNLPDMSQFPLLQELFVWNDSQSGALHPTSTHLTSVLAAGNRYTEADFSGCFPGGGYGQIDLSNNRLASLNIAGCPGLMSLDARNNNLSRAAVDGILQALDGFVTSGGSVNLTGNMPPTDTGHAYASNLEARGWTVALDSGGDTAPPVISSLACSVSATRANITWRTNEKASATLDYGETAAYGTALLQTELTLLHFVPLTGLAPDTTYHFRVTCEDDLGDHTVSSDFSFRTDSSKEVYWEDDFHRADGDPGNGWAPVNDATAEIVGNVLRRTDSGSYRILYNPAGGNLPADYYVTLTVPNATILRSWWGLIGRYFPSGGMGSGNKVFWMDQGYQHLGIGDAEFGNGYTIAETGGYPPSWSLNRVHTVTLGYAASTVTVYLDGREFGHFADATNNRAGTGVGLVGDGGGVNYDVFDIKATSYLPSNDISSSFQFTKLPCSGWVEEGHSLDLAVGVVDTVRNATYQWRKDGGDLPGATASTYTVETAALDDGGVYVCAVQDETSVEHATPPVRIEVVPAGSLPAASPGGLAVLAALLVALALWAESCRAGTA